MTVNVLMVLMVVSWRSVSYMRWSWLLWCSLFRKNVKNTSLKIMTLVAEAFFLFICCKLCPLSSVEMGMNDGERHFFVLPKEMQHSGEKRKYGVAFISKWNSRRSLSHTLFWRKFFNWATFLEVLDRSALALVQKCLSSPKLPWKHH